MAFYSFPEKYDPNAKKRRNWLGFFWQVVNTEDIPLLQEWFGYCLLPDYRFHYALWVHGEGRNGKGVFDRTIQGIVGKNNVVSVGLEELDGEHRFVLKDLLRQALPHKQRTDYQQGLQNRNFPEANGRRPDPGRTEKQQRQTSNAQLCQDNDLRQ